MAHTKDYILSCLLICADMTRKGTLRIQLVPAKMRLEMVIGMQIEILDGQSSGLFSKEPLEKRPVRTIEILDGQSSGLFSKERFSQVSFQRSHLKRDL